MSFYLEFTTKDVRNIILKRQINKYDAIVGFSGDKGKGKSTIIEKILSPIEKREIELPNGNLEAEGFDQWEQQIYSRKEVMRMLERKKYGIIWDDEAVRTAYKRKFYDSDQQLLIQMLNMYRDHHNIYMMAIPHFYDLDKDLRDLIQIHIHIISRGVGIIHMPTDSLYSTDKWDTAYNKKVEESWAEKRMKNPDFKPPYNKLTTFCGYIYFNALTPIQQALYDEIKETKRKEVYEEEMQLEGGLNSEANFYEQIYNRVKGLTMTNDMLSELCLINSKNLSSVKVKLNNMLKDRGSKESLAYYLDPKRHQLILKDVAVDKRFGYLAK